MALFKRLVASRAFQKAVGVMAAEYLRLVWKTTRWVEEPEGIHDRGLQDLPIIVAMWHGQHFLAAFIKGEHRGKVLVSRHRDGEINAIAAEYLGIETIRGSGAHGPEFQRKGGVGAFHQMLEALDQGWNVALTADVPKVARISGMGIVKLAALSGRPIYLLAIATRHRITLKNWDRTTINLPFGRGVLVGGGPVRVARDADAATLEAARKEVQDTLNAMTRRGYEMVDGKPGGAPGE